MFKKTFLIVFFLLQNLLYAEVVWMDPLDLVTPYRIDLMAKYIYAKHKMLGVDSDWAFRLYKNHLHVWINLFDHDKNQNQHMRADKTCLEDFISVFNNVLNSIKTNEFDSASSIVPLGIKGIADGAHRVASCLIFNKKVAVENKRRKKICHATADFFKKRERYVSGGLPQKYIDAMCLQYCELKKNSRAIISSCSLRDNVFESIIKEYGDLICKKVIDLSSVGFVNTLKLFGDDSRSKQSLLTCNDMVKCTVWFVDVRKLAALKIVQKKLSRKLEKDHFLVVINNHEESLKCAQTFLNDNSIDFLNTVDLITYHWLDDVLDVYKTYLFEQDYISENVCICGIAARDIALGVPLAKIGFLSHGGNTSINKKVNNCVFFNYIDGDLMGKEKIINKDDIIFNPENHFYYAGVKIAKQCFCDE